MLVTPFEGYSMCIIVYVIMCVIAYVIMYVILR